MNENSDWITRSNGLPGFSDKVPAWRENPSAGAKKNKEMSVRREKYQELHHEIEEHFGTESQEYKRAIKAGDKNKCEELTEEFYKRERELYEEYADVDRFYADGL